MSLLERVFFFHQEIQKNKYPNSNDIAEQFEVSQPTAKRDIAYLRDRLLAPLSYDQQKHGYFYLEDDFHLPFEESPRIVFLLAMLGKLAGEAGLGSLKEVKQLEKRLSSMITGDYSKIVASLQVQWIEVEPIARHIFEAIIEAIAKNRLVYLDYRSLSGDSNERAVAPLQVINYQGRWYLFAFCTLRGANRLFHMARITQARVTDLSPSQDICFDQGMLEKSFGIFQGEVRYYASIRFTSTAAELVRHQRWHKNQKVEEVEGGILLKLPVSDHREIIMKILQYGNMATVISPPELVAKVTDEISGMAENYQRVKS